MKIKRICTMADITRCQDGKDGIILWLSGIMEGIISRICDIPFYIFSNDELKDMHLSIYKAYGIDLSKNDLKYTFLSVPQNCWVKLCFEEPNEQVLDIVNKYFKDTLVISREIAPILKKAFEILNIPYVDLAIHSVRYLDDLIMGATSNIPEIYEEFKKYEINKEVFYFYADLLKAEYRFKNLFPDNIKKDTNFALFLAQTPVDRSLLDFENKKLVTFNDYKKDFENLTKTHQKVFYKPHPFYQDEKTMEFIKSFHNAKIVTNENIYKLLSLPEYKTIASISSGTINEARYFGKKTQCYLGQPYHYSEEYPDKSKLTKDIYVTVGKNWITSAFWSVILKPVINTKDVYRIDIDKVQNKLRRILNISWGYQDCDSVYVRNYINNYCNSSPCNLTFLKKFKTYSEKIKNKYRKIKALYN